MFIFFFFNDPATTEIYTLSLHDALPIYPLTKKDRTALDFSGLMKLAEKHADRKSTRLNSSHRTISYAVFCLKKKKKNKKKHIRYNKTKHEYSYARNTMNETISICFTVYV